MIEHKVGDLLHSGCDIICHQVNCQGVMGSGIAKQIRDTYPKVYKEYKDFCGAIGSNSVFGTTHICPIPNTKNKYIANMFAQYHYLPRGVNHTNYECFRSCCKHLKVIANRLFPDKPVSIGFPDHIGCGLGGGDWNIVSKIIEEEFIEPTWRVEIWKLN